MKVLLTAGAEADLERIGDHIAERSPQRAVIFVQELRASCLELADMPHRFAEVQRHRQYRIRRRIHGNYLIFYRIGADVVEIIHILHGAMDYDAELFSDD